MFLLIGVRHKVVGPPYTNWHVVLSWDSCFMCCYTSTCHIPSQGVLVPLLFEMVKQTFFADL